MPFGNQFPTIPEPRPEELIRHRNRLRAELLAGFDRKKSRRRRNLTIAAFCMFLIAGFAVIDGYRSQLISDDFDLETLSVTPTDFGEIVMTQDNHGRRQAIGIAGGQTVAEAKLDLELHHEHRAAGEAETLRIEGWTVEGKTSFMILTHIDDGVTIGHKTVFPKPTGHNDPYVVFCLTAATQVLAGEFPCIEVYDLPSQRHIIDGRMYDFRRTVYVTEEFGSVIHWLYETPR